VKLLESIVSTSIHDDDDVIEYDPSLFLRNGKTLSIWLLMAVMVIIWALRLLIYLVTGNCIREGKGSLDL
jgi:hypothetical protein